MRHIASIAAPFFPVDIQPWAYNILRSVSLPGSKEVSGTVEVIEAKFLIGCDGTDGAQSWVTNQLDSEVKGASTESI